MVAMPCILRQNEKPGLLSVLMPGCIVAYMNYDAVNNVSAIMGSPLIPGSPSRPRYHQYGTGNIVGTGDSLC
jgi:hypothetical protein